MIILIILSISQAIIIPGIIITLIENNLSKFDRIILAVPLSLLSNFYLVALLYYLNFYNQTSMLSIVGLEIIFFTTYQRLKKESLQCYKSFWPKIRILNFVFLISFLVFFTLIYKNEFLTVFYHSDAIVSWNRWAEELSEHNFYGSWGYPLGISVLYSLVYVISDNTNLQSFSKLITVFFQFVGGISLIRSGMLWPKYNFAFLITAFGYYFVLGSAHLGFNFLFSGYADPFSATYGALLLYGLALTQHINKRETNESNPSNLPILVSLVIASSALVKITGVILFIEYFFLINFINTRNKWQPNYSIKFSLFLLFIITSWYLFSHLYYGDWITSSYNALLDQNYLSRLLKATDLIISNIGFFVIGLFTLGISYCRLSRVLSVVVIFPLYIFWAFVASYDTRAAYIFLPILTFVAAQGLLCLRKVLFFGYKQTCEIASQMFNARYESLLFVKYLNLLITKIITLQKTAMLWVTEPSAKLAMPIYYLLILAVILIATNNLLITNLSDTAILNHNTEQRISGNNDGINRRIFNILQEDSTSKIISCWQHPYGLPGAKKRYYASGNCTVWIIDKWICGNSDLKYFIYWRPEEKEDYPTLNQVRSHIERLGQEYSEEELANGYVIFTKK